MAEVESLGAGAVSPVALAASRVRPVIAFSYGIRYDDCMPALLLQL